MRALSTSELLNVWERGIALQPVQRALALLAAACPETSPDMLAQLSIGQRDARLLTLREWAFGSQLVSLAVCPECQERLEMDFPIADLHTEPAAAPAEEELLTAEGYEICFRRLNSLDLLAIASNENGDESRERLLQRCVLQAFHENQEVSPEQLSANVIAQLVQKMSEADPQAEIRIDITCPACRHHWQAIFDVLAFFWAEINAWAQDILRDVHTLAAAYGWREIDILAMSPARRQCYLQMVSG